MSAGAIRGPYRTLSSNRGFAPVVMISLIAHAVAIGYALYLQHRAPRTDIFKNSMPVQLVQLGKRRDPKLLPKKVVDEPPPAPVDEGIALQTGKEDATKAAPAPKKEKKLSDAAKRLLEGKGSNLDQALKKIEEKEGDPSGDIHGTTTDPNAAATGYQKQVTVSLQSQYRLPETIPASQRRFLKADVVLFIDRDGSIARYEFAERHPNEAFMAALEVLLKSIRLPAPPPALAAEMRDTGMLVKFHL